MSELYDCPACNGAGYLLPAFPPQNNIKPIGCPFCRKGKVRVKPNIELGKQLHDARIAAKITLRDACNALNITVDGLQRVEYGIYDPRQVLLRKMQCLYSGKPVVKGFVNTFTKEYRNGSSKKSDAARDC